MEEQDDLSGNTGLLTWELNYNTLIIGGYGDMPNYRDDPPWYPYNKAITAVLIEDGVTSIGDWAFEGCEHLTSINIPNNIECIGDYVFWSSGLTSITIPSSVISIGKLLFCYCDNFTFINVEEDNPIYSSKDGILFNKDKTVLLQYPMGRADTHCVIPESVTRIEDCAFDDCSNLISINIPNSVTAIGGFAFSGCENLTSIFIPNSVTNIEDGAFGDCSKLTSFDVSIDNPIYSSEDGVLFNKSKTLLIQYPKAKTDKDYTIPNNVAIVEKEAFAFCNGLTSITIPETVSSVGSSTFCRCRRLKHINLQCEIPPTINWIIDMKTFEDIDKDTCVLYVPYGSKDKYANAEGWKEFTNIQEETE